MTVACVLCEYMCAILTPATMPCAANMWLVAGSDFPNVGPQDIETAMPVLQRAGVPYYVHAELPTELQEDVQVMLMLPGCNTTLWLEQSHISAAPQTD